jgi:hypothetical protein
MTNPWWSKTTMLFMQYIFLHPLKHDIWASCVNLNENPIDESNATLELWDVYAKGNLVLNNKPFNLVAYGFINAKWNENHIITYYILALIPK